VVFRKRLLTGWLESLIFQAVLDQLVKEGWVAKRSQQRLDSTHIYGLLSHISRLECVRETIRLALEYLERRQLLPESWTTMWEYYVENYERDEQGEYQQTRAQPTGAVHNPHEPEAQWSTKSTIKDKTWVGYKTQVAETVQDEPREAGEPTQDFITALVTQNASESDKPGMSMVLSEQANMG